MSFIRDSYYKITFAEKGSGPIDLVPLICYDSNQNPVQNPRVHVLDQVFPKNARNFQELVE